MFQIFRHCVLRTVPYVRRYVRRGMLRIDTYRSTVCCSFLRYVMIREGVKRALHWSAIYNTQQNSNKHKLNEADEHTMYTYYTWCVQWSCHLAQSCLLQYQTVLWHGTPTSPSHHIHYCCSTKLSFDMVRLRHHHITLTHITVAVPNCPLTRYAYVTITSHSHTLLLQYQTVLWHGTPTSPSHDSTLLL